MIEKNCQRQSVRRRGAVRCLIDECEVLLGGCDDVKFTISERYVPAEESVLRDGVVRFSSGSAELRSLPAYKQKRTKHGAAVTRSGDSIVFVVVGGATKHDALRKCELLLVPKASADSDEPLRCSVWRDIPPLPEPRHSCSVAFLGDHLYVVGGRAGPGAGGPLQKSILRFKIFEGEEVKPGTSWETVAFLRSGCYLPSVAVSEGHVMIFGGGQGSKHLQDVTILCTVTGRLFKAPPLNIAREAALVESHAEGLLIGQGYHEGKLIQQSELLRFGSTRWQLIEQRPGHSNKSCAATIFGSVRVEKLDECWKLEAMKSSCGVPSVGSGRSSTRKKTVAASSKAVTNSSKVSLSFFRQAKKAEGEETPALGDDSNKEVTNSSKVSLSFFRQAKKAEGEGAAASTGSELSFNSVSEPLDRPCELSPKAEDYLQEVKRCNKRFGLDAHLCEAAAGSIACDSTMDSIREPIAHDKLDSMGLPNADDSLESWITSIDAVDDTIDTIERIDAVDDTIESIDAVDDTIERIESIEAVDDTIGTIESIDAVDDALEIEAVDDTIESIDAVNDTIETIESIDAVDDALEIEAVDDVDSSDQDGASRLQSVYKLDNVSRLLQVTQVPEKLLSDLDKNGWEYLSTSRTDPVNFWF